MEYLLSIVERTKTELCVMSACSAAGACLSFLVGGLDAPIQALLVLIVADYLTGMIAAWRTGTLASDKGYRGILKKTSVVAVVALANMLDTAMGVHTLRAMAVCGYAGMEGLSLLENVDRAGYGEYIPAYVRTRLVQLRREKGL